MGKNPTRGYDFSPKLFFSYPMRAIRLIIFREHMIAKEDYS